MKGNDVQEDGYAMIEHSVISERLPIELWLLAHGIDPDRERFAQHVFVCDEDRADKAVTYYDYTKTVRDLCHGGMGLNAAIEMAAKRHRVTARTIRNARRYMGGWEKWLGEEWWKNSP